jgi:hypothetical protein
MGEVYNLKSPSDIEGSYTAGQEGVAVAGGARQDAERREWGSELGCLNVRVKHSGCLRWVELILRANGGG